MTRNSQAATRTGDFIIAIYEASVSRAFSASHSILLPDGQPETPHDHLWHVTATFRSADLQGPSAVVIDFVEVQRALDAMAGELEGTSLNAMPFFADGRCSAERVAEYLCGDLARRLRGRQPWRLSVSEAPGCSAAFYP
jgi:6-pyruvoyltetrahydropterin/6-carboxytetrahydropterin synthase